MVVAVWAKAGCTPDQVLCMSVSTSGPARIDLPPTIRGLLGRVRSRLRRDALLAGISTVACGFALLFWGTLGLDTGWFQLQRMELPVGLRSMLLVLLIPVVLLLFARRILHPLLRSIGDHDVALLVERRFPQFQDRLVTAVESSRGLPVDGPLSMEMLRRAVSQAELQAATVQEADLFETRRLRNLAIAAAVLLCSILIPSMFNPGLPQRWWNAFVLCQEVYWQRTTLVHVAAIAQPDDRRVEFRPLAEGSQALVYRHPRSADLELEFSIPEHDSETGRTWIVPDRIRVDVIRRDGSRSRAWVNSSDGRRYRFFVTQLREPVQIEVLAGDYRNLQPWLVEIVDVPGLDSIRLQCVYPEYTGWNQLRETAVTVTGSELPLPEGTAFQLAARAAKPLQSARILTERFEIEGDRAGSRVVFFDGRVQPVTGPALIGSDGVTIQAGFRVLTTSESETSAVAGAAGGGGPAAAGDRQLLNILPNTSLRFALHDMDDVKSASPETLRISGVRDVPPVVVAQLTGIGNSITKRARIPVAGRLRDDYGLQSARFEFQVDDETGWRPRNFRSVPQPGSTDFSLSRGVDEAFEYFEVQPLELSEGQSLTLSVVAADGNPSPGPGQTRSAPLAFQIVSDDELLSILYTREIGLRTRFEEVIGQLEDIRRDLEFHQQVAVRADAAGAGAAETDVASLSTCGSRSGNSLRRQANELNAIIESFEEIVRQLVNNAIPLHNAETMQAGIVDPLKQARDVAVPQVDRAVAAFRTAVTERVPVAELAKRSEAELAGLITALRAILDNVRDLAEFHEALRDLKQLSEEQQRLMEETKRLMKNRLLDDLLK